VIPQAHITAWRAAAPWPDDAQVEQDLVLSRAVVELFRDPALAGKMALRGGTALNKLYITPQCRYSEDVDLVQTKAEPIGPVLDAIRANLDVWLGNPSRKASGGNVTLIYRFESEIAPVRQLRLKVEINTREHFTVLGLQDHRLAIANPWFTASTLVSTYQLNELLSTKLRALYQRRKSRDLFDLWLCLDRKLLNPTEVVACFGRYMAHGGLAVSRAQFEQNLHDKEYDPDFMDDITPLLNPAVKYDSTAALKLVRTSLIERIQGEPWRGDRK
jgi:predicted nucleotidyltransferase component of viral defense system